MIFPEETITDAAKRLGAGLSLGRGKTARIVADLREKIGKPCPYCCQRLSLSNCVYDHRQAIGSQRLRKTFGATKKALDKWENLQLICKPCNTIKSDLNHEEFLGLMSFFYRFPSARRKMLERFRKERQSYQFRRQ